MVTFQWTEPPGVAKERAAIWNRGRRSVTYLGGIFLVSWVAICGLMLLMFWIKMGEPLVRGPVVGGVVLALVLTPLFWLASRTRAVRRGILLDDATFTITGESAKEKRYADLVGFAVWNHEGMPCLSLFDPQGYHDSLGIDPTVDEGSLRGFLSARIPEMVMEDAPEPRLRQGGGA